MLKSELLKNNLSEVGAKNSLSFKSALGLFLSVGAVGLTLFG